MKPHASQPGACKVRKRPVRVQIRFARTDGVMPTLEGEVRYAVGDALATGQLGDEWPIPRARFLSTYEPDGDFPIGQDGTYRKRPLEVWALQLTAPRAVALSGGRGVLNGNPGDWLVEFSSDDFGIVNAAVFAETYEVVA